jgi:hypothetical protein
LLSGVPKKQFVCKWRGNHPSPILHVLGFDTLQNVVNDLLSQGGTPLHIQINDPKFPIIHHADDTLLIMHAYLDQLLGLMEALHKFTLSTGRKVNYQISSMVRVNVDGAKVTQLASNFGC